MEGAQQGCQESISWVSGLAGSQSARRGDLSDLWFPPLENGNSLPASSVGWILNAWCSVEGPYSYCVYCLHWQQKQLGAGGSSNTLFGPHLSSICCVLSPGRGDQPRLPSGMRLPVRAEKRLVRAKQDAEDSL